ncbi:thioesterase domain-containing protein, partial [Acinetobacter baumannii]|uniref:thioesterase domain-containing protein n=1 Tax=Acinetobacter baumannii TaxID=470 RepID=UPI001C081B60
DQINQAQPAGEIRLLGYSLGGAVAFDVAARLIAAGRPVKFIGILDTSIDGVTSHYREAIARTVQRIQAHRTTIYRMSCRAIAKCVARLGA